jgi:hypothetical protein
VTGSIDDVRALLAQVAEQLGAAQKHAELARARIADATAVLSGLDEQHSETLVPEDLRRAADELDHGLELIGGGVMAVADIDARL